MKILIFLKKWKGGVGSVISSVRSELEERGHEVACVSREDDWKIFSSIKNLHLLRKKCLTKIKTENPDVIYTQDWSMALPLLFPHSICRDRHFCCFHGMQFGIARYFQIIVGGMLSKKLVVVGDSLGGKFSKGNVVYNGVSLNLFKPLNKKRSYLGWIDKETETLTKQEVVSLANRLDLKPLIAENFNIPFDKMNEDFYNRCEVFVSFPPASAGFNLCWVEAMAAGVPKIVGNNEGIGWKLNIDKFKSKEELLENMKSVIKGNYRQEIEKSDLTWKNHVDKLLRIWNNAK